MLRLVAFALALQLASFAAESAAQTVGMSGRASRGTLQVGIRIASAGEASSPYATFEKSLDTAMRSSARPLDWALAATASPNPSRTIGAPTPRSDGDLYRAAQAAPNDALVQWLVANYADTTTPEGASHRAAAIDALTRIEPDNAAVWMQVIYDAGTRGDATGVDDALTRMAESRHFDEHFVDIAHAWFDVYNRYPPPAGLATDGYDAGFVAAMAKAAATAMPSYQSVILACKPPATRDGDFDRKASCTRSGRLMLQHGHTLVAQSIGFAVLRNLDAATDADRAANRNLDWYRANSLRGTGDQGDVRDAFSYESDWRRMDDEIDVVKSALRRSGLPTEAPEGWSPAHSTDVAAAR